MASEEFHEVVVRLSASLGVEHIAVVGSAIQGPRRQDSAIDIFVYLSSIPLDVRYQMATDLADPDEWQSVLERTFGDGDVWRLRGSGPWIDLIYWSMAWAEEQLQRVLIVHQASKGYTTAFWRFIRSAEPLYERGSWPKELQERADPPLPEPLRRNIVEINFP